MEITYIMPVYNAERTLRKSIDSVLEQKYLNELIVVNDGSTDSSSDILEEYKSGSSKIKILNQKNSGPSSARNLGLEATKSEYVSFIDSDDYLEPNATEVISNILSQKDYDCIFFAHYRLFLNSQKKMNKIKITYLDNIIDLKNVSKSEISSIISKTNFNNIWNKVYKKEVLFENNIKFNSQVIMGEDYIFNLEVLNNSSNIFMSNEALYNYVEVNTSLTHRFFENKFEELSFVRNALKNFLINNNMNLNQYYNSLLRNIFSYSSNLNLKNSNLKFKERVKRIRKVLKSEEVLSMIKYYKLRSANKKSYLLIVKLKLSLLITILGFIRVRLFKL